MSFHRLGLWTQSPSHTHIITEYVPRMIEQMTKEGYENMRKYSAGQIYE